MTIIVYFLITRKKYIGIRLENPVRYNGIEQRQLIVAKNFGRRILDITNMAIKRAT